MAVENDGFERSIRWQIAINQKRTPTERFLALCDLLDVAREMATRGPEARERRLRALAVREANRERFRAQLRQLIADQRADASAGV